MSILIYAEAIRGAVTKLDINGQGAEARLDPGTPLIVKGEYKVQNPKSDPTDTVQIILFLGDKFLKCLYNDVPDKAPNYTVGTFEFKCTVPTEEGKYALRVGWGYNWNWPEQAYNFLLTEPERIMDVGVLYVGPVKEVAAALLPIALVAIPVGTIIGMVAVSKKR